MICSILVMSNFSDRPLNMEIYTWALVQTLPFKTTSTIRLFTVNRRGCLW